RGLAVVQTHSIVDAMRADRNSAESGAFNIALDADPPAGGTFANTAVAAWRARSEEHTSELQSRENLVCRLLLEKKKKSMMMRDILVCLEFCRTCHVLNVGRKEALLW